MPNSSVRWKLAAVLRPASEAVSWRLPAVLLAVMSTCAVSAHAGAAGQQADSPVLSERQLARQLADEREWSRRFLQASRAYANGQWDEAERLAKRAVAFDRDQPDGLTLLAAVYAAQGRDELAGQTYQAALALSPRSGGLLNNYGAWLCGQGHSAEALVLFDRALQDPAAPLVDVHVNAGICAQRSGQWARAEVELRQALDYLPAHPGALQAMAQLQLERGNAMAARAFYQRRLAAAPADPSVLQLAVRVEEQLGDKAAAEHHKLRLEQVRGTVRDADARLINGDH